ncbi:MAG: alpha/beta fold hydrolase [Pseudomonadota bacterium]
MTDAGPSTKIHAESSEFAPKDRPVHEDRPARVDRPDRPMTELLDDLVMTTLATRTGGASALAFAVALYDWAAHLALAPGAQLDIATDAVERTSNVARAAVAGQDADHAENGAFGPYAVGLKALAGLHDAYGAWVDAAVDRTPGVSAKHREMVRFAAKSAAEPFRPENFLFSNAEALKRTADENGANLLRGWINMWSDVTALGAPEIARRRDTSTYRVGETIAASEGKVVYRNRLIELIQYTPSTKTVRAEPILITPAWIMKFYILDLQPHNSLIRHLVDQGFTVFCISWCNPGKEEADLGFDDYRKLGVLAALDAIEAILPDRRVHGVGYCLGGTLLSIAAADLGRDGSDRLASLTLLAAQTDFRDAGELALFVDEDQLGWLEASMDAKGYLGAEQMAGAFAVLRSRDLMYRRRQRAYLFGETEKEFDLMVWNADSTRMPKQMHSEYLRRLFLNNDFTQGRFIVDDEPVAISDIRAPIFALGTEKDHVAPWRSVFKIHLFADVEVTFALTNGGHNAGVISDPGHPRRRHKVLTKQDCERYLSPDIWLERAEARDGSWWTTWFDWLAAKSSGEKPAATPKRADIPGNLLRKNARLPDAPGAYVMQR